MCKEKMDMKYVIPRAWFIKEKGELKHLLLTNFLYLSLWRPTPTAPEETKIISKPWEFNSLSWRQIIPKLLRQNKIKS